MKRSLSYPVLLITVLSGISATGPAAAAQGRLTLELAAGPAPYDLSGTGTGTSGGAFLAWRKPRGFVIEPGLTFFSYRSQFGERTILLFPEISLQGELGLGSFHPFLGAGAGASIGLQGAQQRSLTLHAVAGTRVDLSQNWGLLGQMRIRAVRPWTGNTTDFLFGVSRNVQRFAARPPAPGFRGEAVDRTLIPPARFEIAGHLGVHVDRSEEADRVVTDGFGGMYAAPGEASALGGRMGYWIRPALGVQLALSRSSNESWGGSSIFRSAELVQWSSSLENARTSSPGFANRTTYISARGALRTSPARRMHFFAAAGPALMLYGGPGENLRTSDANVGGVLEGGARLRVSQWLAVELALSNYFYGSRYREEGSVFRHDLLILPGVVVSWN